MDMNYNFGNESTFVSYRYDEPPKVRSEFRTCVITVQRSKKKSDLVSFKIAGFNTAISDLVGGTNISIRSSDDQNIEFERYKIRYFKGGLMKTVYCADCCVVSS